MLPASGSISLTQVMDELRVVAPSRAYPISLGDADVRALAGVPSGAISLTDLYGKSAYVPMAGSLPDVVGGGTASPASPYTEHVPVEIVLTSGAGPFSYVWSHVSGDGSVTLANAASTTADFLISIFNGPGVEKTQVVQCVVTDVMGATLTRTGTVIITLT